MDDDQYPRRVALDPQGNGGQSRPGGLLREAITRCALDGSECETYATGLRNAVDFTWAPDGTLIATEMGMGHTDPDFPPDEINVIRQGADYGWPYCHADNQAIDPDFVEHPETNHHDDLLRRSNEDCEDKQSPTVSLPAYSSPLGLTFYDEDAFPTRYRGDLFVALHGSWDIHPSRGYKLIHVTWDSEHKITDFAMGWLASDGDIRGRPVALVVGPDSALYVSDGTGGRIYRITYQGEQVSM